MNDIWNLDPIYKGFDDPAFAADMTALGQTTKALTDFTARLDGEEPLQGLKKGVAHLEAFSELVGKLAGYASLRQAANTRDAEAGSRRGQIMAVYSSAAGPMAAFQSWASKLPDLMELVAGDEVEAGAVIGKVGDTSVSEMADEPHLHFELMVNGESVNPLDYITEASKEASLDIVSGAEEV